MPELPEVESIRRQLAPALAGSVITGVWRDAYPSRRLGDLSELDGYRFTDVRRRGKFLLLGLDATPQARMRRPLELVINLGMSGALRLLEPLDPAATGRHVRVWMNLDDGRTLVLNDPRRFGRVCAVAPGDYRATAPTLAQLGPEPLSDNFTPDLLLAGANKTKASIKAVLLGQRIVAGIGNIYADESLWLAGIHPCATHLDQAQAARLHDAIRQVLEGAIEREGTTFRDYQMVNGASGRNASHLNAYGQQGRPCARCATPLEKIRVAQRGTSFCPACQAL